MIKLLVINVNNAAIKNRSLANKKVLQILVMIVKKSNKNERLFLEAHYKSVCIKFIIMNSSLGFLPWKEIQFGVNDKDD